MNAGGEQEILIYTDGGARGNPGPAGAGAVVYGPGARVRARAKKALGVMTNNEAEYEAVLLGLSEARRLLGARTRATRVRVRMDSQLVARQLSGEYQIKEERLAPYFIKVWNMRVRFFPNIRFTHVPRAENREADRLANEAMDSASG